MGNLIFFAVQLRLLRTMRSDYHLGYLDLKNKDSDTHVVRPKSNSRLMYIMVFAVEYSYALFNVYAGPLFANIIAGEILDSIIWGIAPLLFFMIRPYLKEWLVVCSNPYLRRFNLLVLLVALKLLAYACLSYNQRDFKWNDFSLVFNLDFGYVLLDLCCKSVYVNKSKNKNNSIYTCTMFPFLLDTNTGQFVFSCEQEQQSRQMSSLLSLKYSFAAHILCYSVTMFYAWSRESIVAQSQSTSVTLPFLLAAVISVAVPFFYYIRNQQRILGQTREQSPSGNSEAPTKLNLTYERLDILVQLSWEAKLEVAGAFFQQCCIATTLAYSTLWIMNGLTNSMYSESAAFTYSTLYGSIFFALSTVLYLLCGYILHYFGRWLRVFTCCFQLIYAVVLADCYLDFSAAEVSLIILGTGIHLALSQEMQDKSIVADYMSRIFVLSEFLIFCVIPFYISFFTHTDITIYILLSSVFCALSIVCSLLHD